MGELGLFVLGAVCGAAAFGLLHIFRRRVAPVTRIDRLTDVLARVHDDHKRWTGAPLVITFSHWWARDKFVREIEASIGAPPGEIGNGAVAMYDGIELRAVGSVRDKIGWKAAKPGGIAWMQ